MKSIAEAFSMIIRALNEVSPAVLSFSLFLLGGAMSLGSYYLIHRYPMQTSEFAGELMGAGTAVIACAAMAFRNSPEPKIEEKKTEQDQPK